MGGVLKSLLKPKVPKRKCKILLLGLDGAGKTTILYSLKLGEVRATIPTIGFNVEELSYKTINMLVWDVGGQERLRALWPHYFSNANALIYVVDSSDVERIELAGQELQRILYSEEMKKSILLVLANKRDQAKVSMEEITKTLKLENMKRNWAAFPVTAIQENGVEEAMNWLINNIDKLQQEKHVHFG